MAAALSVNPSTSCGYPHRPLPLLDKLQTRKVKEYIAEKGMALMANRDISCPFQERNIGRVSYISHGSRFVVVTFEMFKGLIFKIGTSDAVETRSKLTERGIQCMEPYDRLHYPNYEVYSKINGYGVIVEERIAEIGDYEKNAKEFAVSSDEKLEGVVQLAHFVCDMPYPDCKIENVFWVPSSSKKGTIMRQDLMLIDLDYVDCSHIKGFRNAQVGLWGHPWGFPGLITMIPEKAFTIISDVATEKGVFDAKKYQCALEQEIRFRKVCFLKKSGRALQFFDWAQEKTQFAKKIVSALQLNPFGHRKITIKTSYSDLAELSRLLGIVIPPDAVKPFNLEWEVDVISRYLDEKPLCCVALFSLWDHEVTLHV